MTAIVEDRSGQRQEQEALRMYQLQGHTKTQKKKHGSRIGFWETGAWQRKSGSWKGGYLREKLEDALKKNITIWVLSQGWITE